ncbi:17354_t:CDS:2, partial [Gigaspora rosea]
SMFSEDLYDEVLIELTELVDGINLNDIRELWVVDKVIEINEGLSNEPAISIRNGQDFSTFEHVVQIDFSFIDSMHGQYVFTPRFISDMDNELAEQEGNFYSQTKKIIMDPSATHLNHEQKHDENLVTGSSHISNESTGIDVVETHKAQARTSQASQYQIMHDQNKENEGTSMAIDNENMLQSITKGKKKRAYKCGNCGEDGYSRSRCPNVNSMK